MTFIKKEALQELIRYRQIRKLYDKYERVLIPSTLVFGVIVDSITFANINILSAFCLLGVYLIIAGIAIAFLNVYDAGLALKDKNIFKYLRLAAPLTIQFTFGALLSACFIFYIFSGTLFVSWPLIALIVILMITNDVLRHHYLRLIVQIAVYFFILFSVFSIILPFAWKTISVAVFLFSGALSLIIMFGYIWLLSRVVPQIKSKRQQMTTVVIIIFACVNALYFLNVIPPIPLSLKDSAIARDLQRTDQGYVLSVEEQPLWQRIISGQTFHKTASDRVFVYTAIYAPSQLNTAIFHHWQYYDQGKKDWVTRDKLFFNITGGAKHGYRGFSVKSNTQYGLWRVDVETKTGQVLGRVKFKVAPYNEQVKLKTIIR